MEFSSGKRKVTMLIYVLATLLLGIVTYAVVSVVLVSRHPESRKYQ
jgi:hypothetical protein